MQGSPGNVNVVGYNVLYPTEGKPLKDLFEQEKKYITYILGVFWHLSEGSRGREYEE